MIEDEFDHFTDAQDVVWPNVTLELTMGAKRTHWMWFTFPVLEGVAESNTALFFALRDLDEARDYISHPILGPRMTECIGLVMGHADKSAADIFGDTDAFKLHNCMTLFAKTGPTPNIFHDVLATFFDGAYAQKTIDLLRERSATL